MSPRMKTALLMVATWVLAIAIVAVFMLSKAQAQGRQPTREQAREQALDTFKFQVGWECGKAWTMGFFATNGGPKSVLKLCKSKEEYWLLFSLDTKDVIQGMEEEVLKLVWDNYLKGVRDGLQTWKDKTTEPKEIPGEPFKLIPKRDGSIEF